MGKIISDLKSLLITAKPAQRGAVASTGADYVSVVTTDGLRNFRIQLGASYKVGEEVLVQGEVLVGKVASETGIPAYSV